MLETIIMETNLIMWVRKIKKYSLTMNNYRNWHFQVNNNLKMLYKEVIAKKLKERGNIKLKPPIVITIAFFNWTRRKYDLDWMCIIHNKFFCDALVELWYLEDDSCEFIKCITYLYWWYDKGNQRVEITVDGF